MNKQSRLVPETPLVGAASPLRESVAASATPYGKQPICPTCNRGATYSCICDDGPFAREDEQMPAADVVRIMGEFYPDSGWALADRCAYGMGGAK